MKVSKVNRREFVQLGGMFAGAGLAALSINRSASAAAAGLAQTPPMGWNSFDSYGVYLHEQAALKNIDAMAEKLLPFGYDTFVVDNGWFGEYQLFPGTNISQEKHASDVRINEYGLLQPSKCYFPNGLGEVVSRCRQKGLKFGVHLMRGIPRKAVALNTPVKGTNYRAQDIADQTSTCSWCAYNYGVDMTKPGAQEFYNSLVDQLAGWGIDFIKADDIVPFPKEVEALANAIARNGRPIILSLSPGGTVDPAHIDSFRKANMLRVTHDIWDDQKGIDACFEAWKRWQGSSRPGFWIDMDMIPFGQLCLMSPPEYVSAKGHGGPKEEKEGLAALAGKGTTRQSLFTRDQMYTFITLRALSASPLMVGGDLPTLDDFSLSLLTDSEMLACNQNGVMGRLVYENSGVEIWNTPHKDREDRGWAGVFNRSEQKLQLKLNAPMLGLTDEHSYTVQNIWAKRPLDLTKASGEVVIPGNGALFLRYEEV